MPKFMEDLGNDKFRVITRHGVYVLEEQSGEIYELCSKLAENSNGKYSVQKMLMVRSIIEPKIDESNFSSITKGSDFVRLQAATLWIYGFDDFLQEEDLSQKSSEN